MLYSIPVPEGAVTSIVPFEIVHVGCTVTEAVGVAGALGAAFTVKDKPDEIQPVAVFFAVTVYGPGFKPLNVPEIW